MRIEPFSLPLSTPLETAAGTIQERKGFLIRLAPEDTEYGEPGVGEATPLPGWTESLEACRDALERSLDVLAQDGAREALAKADGTPAARHGISLALADSRARSQEGRTSPRRKRSGRLYSMLNDDRRIERIRDPEIQRVRSLSVESVPVYATLGDCPTEEASRRASEAVEAGFDTLKLKVGARSVEEDLERVRAVRDAVGKQVELRGDANGAWSREEAKRALEGLSRCRVAILEQPLPAEDLAGHAELQDWMREYAIEKLASDATDYEPQFDSGGPAYRVAIGVDESVIEAGIDEVLRRDCAQVVILKPMALGGIDRAVAAARRALDAGVTPVVTTTIDAVYARTAAVHVAASLDDEFAACSRDVPPFGLATADWLAEDLAEDPAPVEDGEIRVPQKPGLGVDPDREADPGREADPDA